MSRATRKNVPVLDGFDFEPGRRLVGKYEVECLLGRGWEAEVYKVTEIKTGIPRAMKIFFPHRNVRDRVVRYQAKKLDKLRHSPLMIQYLHSETFRFRGSQVTFLLSEFFEGENLSRFLARQPGKRLAPFEAMHLLHALAAGVEPIHDAREYHGDIHDDNVLVRRVGIRFDVRLLDFFRWGRVDRETIQYDVLQLVRILYDAVGGARRYARQPAAIKAICKGLRRDLITRKFPTAGRLRRYLESFDWSDLEPGRSRR